MLASTRLLPRRNCQKWRTTTMLLVQRTNGLWLRTEMHFQEFCKLLWICQEQEHDIDGVGRVVGDSFLVIMKNLNEIFEMIAGLGPGF